MPGSQSRAAAKDVMRIEKSAHTDGHDFRCIVTKHDGGWEVRQEMDARVVTDVVRHDWSRVETDLALFDYKYHPEH